MALVTAAAENAVYNVAFDTHAYPLSISGRQRLDDVVKLLARTGGGGTDCALPMTWATKQNVQADAFVIYTDSETWAGRQNPAQALDAYRQKTGIAAKAVIVAMAANRFSIGDTRDAGTMTVVGFDATVPEVIADFLR
jgi:60 kDa SS-A/Ro ribonucleoprotein